VSKLVSTKTKLLLALGLIVLGVVGFGGSARAAGETYGWQAAGQTNVIVGSGGGYKTTATFRQSTETATEVRYDATIITNCNNVAGTTSLNLKLAKASGAIDATKTASGTLSYDASLKDCLGNPDTTVVVATGTAAAPGATSTDPVPTDQATKCDGGVMSWILCPIYEGVLKTVRDIENNVIAPFLRVQPINTADTSTAMYKIWSVTRTLANGAFVVIFLVIIFANTLSLSLDSYTMKKLVPRLVAAAILVQFSYLISALAIDIMNIIGGGLGALLLAPIKGQNVVTITNLVGGLSIAGGIAAAVAAVSGVLSGAVIIVLIGAVFAIMGVFFTLIARQILITLMVITAPLAFVAWILPNTSSWFTMWRKNFMSLLLMYPIIILLFVSGTLFGAAASAGTGAGFVGESIRSLISVVANIIPLFFIPATFKWAGSALNTVEGWINKTRSVAEGGVKGSGSYGRLQANNKLRKASMAAGYGASYKVLGKNVTLGRGKVGARMARGAYSGYGAGGHINAMRGFTANRTAAEDDLKKEGTDFATYEVLGKGAKWARAEIAEATARGNTEKAGTYTRALAAAQYQGRINNAAFLAAGATFLGEKGQADSDVLAHVREWSSAYGDPTSKDDKRAGRLIGDQVWRSTREGVRKSTPYITFRNLDGTDNDLDRIKWTINQNQSTMSGFTHFAFEKMRDDGTIALLAQSESGRRTLAGLLGGGGPAAGANQQAIIRQAVLATGLSADPSDLKISLPAGTGAEFAAVDQVAGTVRIVNRTEALRIKASGQDFLILQIDKTVPPI
jgi:hypothetical protein